MLTTLALLLAPALPFFQDPPEEETVEVVDEVEVVEEKIDPAEATKEVARILKDGQREAIAEVLKNEGRVADKKVVKAVAAGLKHKDPEVRIETIRALRFNEDPSTLGILIKQAGNDKLLEDPKAGIEVFMGLGQKADKRAIPAISKGLKIGEKNDRVMWARIAALGRIRDMASIEALMKFQVQGKGRQAHPYMRQINVALVALTGTEPGSRDTWQSWWNDNKKTFEVSEELPELPARYAKVWDQLWTEDGVENIRGKADEAGRKRGRDKGGDKDGRDKDQGGDDGRDDG